MMSKNSHLHHHQCYLGNKYLSHAYLSFIQHCVGCLLAWKILCAIVVVLALFLHLLYLCDNCDEIAKTFLQLVLFLCDTCCLSQSISTISCSLVICVMHLMCLKFSYIQWDKFELCAMLLSNNLFLYIHDFLLVTIVFFLRSFYMCKFLCRWISLST